MFVSACIFILIGDYFAFLSIFTPYINTKLKEINWCGSVCLGSSAPARACPGLSWLDRPSRTPCFAPAGVTVFVVCPVALACLRGAGGVGASGGQIRVWPWPALAEARAAGRLQSCSWPRARHRGCRPQVCAVATALRGDCQARRARGQAVVPQGLLAAAAHARPNTSRGLRD